MTTILLSPSLACLSTTGVWGCSVEQVNGPSKCGVGNQHAGGHSPVRHEPNISCTRMWCAGKSTAAKEGAHKGARGDVGARRFLVVEDRHAKRLAVHVLSFFPIHAQMLRLVAQSTHHFTCHVTATAVSRTHIFYRPFCPTHFSRAACCFRTLLAEPDEERASPRAF